MLRVLSLRSGISQLFIVIPRGVGLFIIHLHLPAGARGDESFRRLTVRKSPVQVFSEVFRKTIPWTASLAGLAGLQPEVSGGRTRGSFLTWMYFLHRNR